MIFPRLHDLRVKTPEVRPMAGPPRGAARDGKGSGDHVGLSEMIEIEVYSYNYNYLNPQVWIIMFFPLKSSITFHNWRKAYFKMILDFVWEQSLNSEQFNGALQLRVWFRTAKISKALLDSLIWGWWNKHTFIGYPGTIWCQGFDSLPFCEPWIILVVMQIEPGVSQESAFIWSGSSNRSNQR